MKNHRADKKEIIGIRVLNIMVVCVLLLLVTPLLMMSHYNIPSGDDWSYGYKVYHTVQNQKGIIAYAGSISDTVKKYYVEWEPRWAAILLAAMAPANFGEQWAHANAWIFIAALIFSQIFFIKQFFGLDKAGFLYIFPCIAGLLMIEIMYVPYPTETFFWWTGAVNYTLLFCISLVYIALVRMLLREEITGGKRIIYTILASVCASICAADNFCITVPVLMVNVLLFIRIVRQWIRGRSEVKSLYIFSLCMPIVFFAVSFLSVMISPALKIQIASRLGGQVSNNIFAAVFLSVAASLRQIFVIWLDFKTICLLLLFVPFIYTGVKKSSLSYAFPVLVSIFSFGLFASMISADMYTRNSTGVTYSLDIWFYAFYVLLLSNEIYWIGWMAKKPRISGVVEKFRSKVPGWCGLLWCLCWGIAIAWNVCGRDLKQLSAYQAYNYVNNGWSQQYAEEWADRLEVLHDPAVKTPVFEKISVYGGYITVYDFYEEDAIEYWINEAAAQYYDKDSIRLKKAD